MAHPTDTGVISHSLRLPTGEDIVGWCLHPSTLLLMKPGEHEDAVWASSVRDILSGYFPALDGHSTTPTAVAA